MSIIVYDPSESIEFIEFSSYVMQRILVYS